MDLGTGLIIGVHTLSLHSAPGFNGVNPGLYVETPDGWTAGAYYNSERRWSVYGGKTLPVTGPIDLTIGAVSGYKAAPLFPLVVPSLRFPLRDGFTLRLALIPKVSHGGAFALHAMIEKRF